MKKLVLSIFSLIALTVVAQDKININGLLELDALNKSSRGYITNEAVIQPIVKMKLGWDESILERYNASIEVPISDQLFLISIPVDKVIEFSNESDVLSVEFGNYYDAQLDFARPSGMVNEVQEGFDYNGTTMSYDGTGVVTGLMDTGIDPNHPSFLTASGTRRVVRAYDYNNNVNAITSTAVRRFGTDNANETHGTHVAGIMAGRSYIDGVYRQLSLPTGGTESTLTGQVPYYGVATGSSIVMAGGQLSDANIIKGVTAAIEYAESQNLPVSVNLSLGSTYGPHDGSSNLEQSLAALGQRGIICIAAGNDGTYDMFAGKTLTSDDTKLNTFIKDNKSSGFDIWTNGPDPITVTVALYDPSNDAFIDVCKTTGANQSSSSSSSSQFLSTMSGTLTLTAVLDNNNNRFHVQGSGTIVPTKNSYQLAIMIEGKAGQQIYIYGYGNLKTSFSSYATKGWTNGTNDGTINGIATAANTIAVGSYNTRNSWPTFDGPYHYSGSFPIGAISNFSSFGESYQGVALPEICAPGAGIISSLNHYYTNNLTTTLNKEVSAQVTSGSTAYYWGNNQGTSMACPFVTGTVALMLQANPDLKVAEVKSILKATAASPETTDASVLKRWGAGKIDALAAVKEVISRKNTGIDNILADASGQWIVRPVGNKCYEVVVDGASNIVATLYSLQGATVATATGNAGVVTIDAAAAAPGVYVLSVTAPNMKPLARKVTL